MEKDDIIFVLTDSDNKIHKCSIIHYDQFNGYISFRFEYYPRVFKIKTWAKNGVYFNHEYIGLTYFQNKDTLVNYIETQLKSITNDSISLKEQLLTLSF